MLGLLIAVLVVSSLSLLLTFVFILHELGWFPHGKYRGMSTFIEETKDGGRRPSARDLAHVKEHLVVDSPYVAELRRQLDTELYDEADARARMLRALERFRANPTYGRVQDLVAVMNRITLGDEIPADVLKLIQEAESEVLTLDIQALEGRTDV